MNVKILADSACDLTDEHYEKYDIDTFSLSVHLDDEVYQDGKSLSPKTVYDAMREGKSPTTSQVSPQQFKNTFTTYAKNNQACIYLALSSELSGTYQTAKMIGEEVQEEYPDWKLHIIDTHCASIGYGLVVLRAAEMAQEEAGLETISDTALYHANHMEHIFTVDDLEYLYRGGRVSKTAAFVGTLLKIKPLLHVDAGKLVPLEKIRGRKKVLRRMIEVMEERGVNLAEQPIGISHGDDLERAEKLAEIIKETYGNTNITIEMVGSVIGAHSGPGTLALFFLNEAGK